MKYLDPNDLGRINFKDFCRGVFAMKGDVSWGRGPQGLSGPCPPVQTTAGFHSDSSQWGPRGPGWFQKWVLPQLPMRAQGRGLGPPAREEGLRGSLNPHSGGLHPGPAVPGPVTSRFCPSHGLPPQGRDPSFSSFLLPDDQTPEEFPSTRDFWAELDGAGHPILRSS